MIGSGRAGRWGTAAGAAGFLCALALALALAGGAAGCKRKKAFAEPCMVDTECASGDCVPFGNVCSRPCTYNKDCAAGFVCRVREDAASGGDHCARAEGNPPGGACETAGECENGQCLIKTDAPGDPGICSRHCQTSEDCPAGMKSCLVVPSAGKLKVCLPGDGPGGAASAAKFGAAPKGKKPAAVPLPRGSASAMAAPPSKATASSTALPAPPGEKKR